MPTNEKLLSKGKSETLSAYDVRPVNPRTPHVANVIAAATARARPAVRALPRATIQTRSGHSKDFRAMADPSAPADAGALSRYRHASAAASVSSAVTFAISKAFQPGAQITTAA